MRRRAFGISENAMKLSLIIPLYNEEDNLTPLMDSIYSALNPLKQDWEVIFVDDGSRDRSLDILRSLVEKDTKHKIGRAHV